MSNAKQKAAAARSGLFGCLPRNVVSAFAPSEKPIANSGHAGQRCCAYLITKSKSVDSPSGKKRGDCR